jgi:hypothetical protein
MFDESQPLHTKIEKVISLSAGKVILENHVKYPVGESNLYYVEKNGKVAWYAERPAPNVHYTRVKLNEEGDTLSAYTTGSQACEIDLKTGKLLSQLPFE